MENEDLLRWYVEVFEKIRKDCDCMSSLEEIRIAISSLSQPNLTNIALKLPLDTIFDCLNTSNEDQLNVAVQILKKFLCVLDPHEVIKLYGKQLGRALEHPVIECQELVLNELQRATKYEDLLVSIAKETPLVASVINCIKSDNISLALPALAFLTDLGKNDIGAQTLFTPPIVALLEKVCSVNDSVRFRIYDMVIDIGCHSAAGMSLVTNNGMLSHLIEEVQSTDLLVQLSALETIIKLATTNHGYQYLRDNHVLDYFSQKLNDTANLDPILIPGYLKFFGNVAHIKPDEIFLHYSKTIQTVFTLCDSDDASVSKAALETIGFLANDSLGKMKLSKFGMEMDRVLKRLGELTISSPTEWKVIALNVFSNIMRPTDQNSEVFNIIQRWFHAFAENPIKILKDYCEKPIEELKLASLHTMAAIAELPWGQDKIKQCPGVVEYLMDRSECASMKCVSDKYNIVKTIYESSCSRSIFDEHTIEKFRVFVAQGMIYTPTITEVALEGAI